MRLANEMQAEYWSVSAKTGEWARGCRGGVAIRGGGPGRWMGGVAHPCSPVRPLLLLVGAGPCGVPAQHLREAGAALPGTTALSRPYPMLVGGPARRRSTHCLNQLQLSACRPGAAEGQMIGPRPHPPPPALTHTPPGFCPGLAGSPEGADPTHGTAYRSLQHL